MKRMLQRPATFLLIALLFAACDFTVDPRQVSTIDIDVRLGSTTVYPGSSFFLGTVTPLTSRDYVFTIENIGYKGYLNLTGSPAVGLTDPDFTVTVQPAAVTLAPGASTTFTLRYSPPDAGTHTAVISIPNNDAGETNFQIGLIGSGGALVIAPSVTGTTPAHTTTPTWAWTSGGNGNGTFRYKMDSSDLTTGATETTALSYTPASPLPDGSHTLYVQEQNFGGTFWSGSGSYAISIEMVAAVGWIGGGSNGWKTANGANSGSSYQYFSGPSSSWIPAGGNVFIVDSSNSRICQWNTDGTAVGWIGGGSNGWKTSIGAQYGHNYQDFYYPNTIFIDGSGNLYISDEDRVCKWDSSGNAIGWIGGGLDGWQTTYITMVGDSLKFFSSPDGVFVDAIGDIYVADYDLNRICKWSASGNAIGWIGGGSDGWKTGSGTSAGSDYRSFHGPCGIFIDDAGIMYIADSVNHRISKWTTGGAALGWLGGGSDGWQTTAGASSGTGYRYFNAPRGIFVDALSYIYICDSYNNRIYKWDSAGTAIGWFGGGSNGWHTTSGNTSGQGLQSFYWPSGIFVDAAGEIYVADINNDRVCKWHQY